MIKFQHDYKVMSMTLKVTLVIFKVTALQNVIIQIRCGVLRPPHRPQALFIREHDFKSDLRNFKSRKYYFESQAHDYESDAQASQAGRQGHTPRISRVKSRNCKAILATKNKSRCSKPRHS